MWKSNNEAPIYTFLKWTFLLAYLSYIISIFGEKAGVFTGGIGTGIDTIISTFLGIFSPMYGAYFVLRKQEDNISVRQFLQRTLHTKEKTKTLLITLFFAITLLIPVLLAGKRTGSSLWILIPAIPLMIIGGGVEEVGWRGFLQPELEKKISFIPATLIVSIIWFAWHVPLWFISSTNQSNYDFLPYLLQLTVMAFVLAAIFRTTKSTLACIMYHAWGNALGSIFEWDFFATYPIHPFLLIYDCLIIIVSIVMVKKAKSSYMNFEDMKKN